MDANDSEFSFTFTPTHPDKKKPRTTDISHEEPSTTRSTRSNKVSTQKAADSTAKASFVAKPTAKSTAIGVRTSVPSKASLNTDSPAPEAAISVQPSSRAAKASSSSSKPAKSTSSKKRKSSEPDLDESDTLEPPEPKKPASPSMPSISPPSSPSPPRSPFSPKRTPISTPEIAQKLSTTPQTSHRTSVASPASPSQGQGAASKSSDAKVTKQASSKRDKPKPSLSPKNEKESKPLNSPLQAPASSSAPSAPESSKEVVTSANSKRADAKKESLNTKKRKNNSVVPLEDNLVSYWDFVNEKRGERLLQMLCAKKSDGTRRYTLEEETSMRIVQSRFFAEAQRQYRPPDHFEPNPANSGLLEGLARYQRVLELLEKEKEELETTQRRLETQLDLVDEAEASAKGKGRKGGKTPSKGRKSTATTPVRSRRSSLATSTHQMDETDAVVGEIMSNLPASESLLSEEEKLFLEDRPATTAQLRLDDFSLLKTKFDALEKLVKQVGYIDNTITSKHASISSAMHQRMVPFASGTRLQLSSVPYSSPITSKK